MSKPSHLLSLFKQRGSFLIKRYYHVLTGASWLIVAQSLNLFSRFGAVWVLTRLLNPKMFGQLNLTTALYVLIYAIFCFPILQSVLRFFPRMQLEGRPWAIRSIIAPLMRRRLIYGVVSVLFFGLVWQYMRTSELHPWTLVAASLCIILEAARSLELNLLNATKSHKSYTIFTSLDNVTRTVFAVSFAYFVGPTATNVLLGYATGTGVTLLLCRRIRAASLPDSRSQEKQSDHKLREELLVYSKPLGYNSFLGWIIAFLDRYLVDLFDGLRSAGLYSAVYSLGSAPFSLINASFGTVLRPILFNAVEHNERAKARNVLIAWISIVGAVSLAALVLIFLLKDWIVRFALGKAYWGSAGILPWIAASYAVQGFQIITDACLYAYHRTKAFIGIQLAGAVTAIALYVPLIYFFKGLGAAIATFLLAFVTVGLSAWRAWSASNSYWNEMQRKHEEIVGEKRSATR